MFTDYPKGIGGVGEHAGTWNEQGGVSPPLSLKARGEGDAQTRTSGRAVQVTLKTVGPSVQGSSRFRRP